MKFAAHDNEIASIYNALIANFPQLGLRKQTATLLLVPNENFEQFKKILRLVNDGYVLHSKLLVFEQMNNQNPDKDCVRLYLSGIQYTDGVQAAKELMRGLSKHGIEFSIDADAYLFRITFPLTYQHQLEKYLEVAKGSFFMTSRIVGKKSFVFDKSSSEFSVEAG